MLPAEIPNPSESLVKFISGSKNVDFEQLSLEIFAHQFQQNLPYQKFCRHLGFEPNSVTNWKKIPAVPTSAFKLPAHPLVCRKEIAKTFLTSGTTTEVRGAHHFPDLSLYEASIAATWKMFGFPKLPTLFLAPSPEENPESSLSHMFGKLNSGSDENFLLRNGRFDLAPLYRSRDSGEPIFVMGTALAFLHFMETHQEFPLPAGSQLLETGGYKGTSRELSKPDFYQQLANFFGLPDSALHNEYSMTELSSQAYATGTSGLHRFPAWCRTLILNPETGNEVRPGETGYLVIHDLANLNSVAAIRTQDFAVRGENDSFLLIGRDPGALPRGCSRTIDQLLTP